MKFPRLQLHLSTCIVLMFVAGGLIGANLANRDEFLMGYPFIAGSTTLIDGAVGESLSTAIENYPIEGLLPAGQATVIEYHEKSFSSLRKGFLCRVEKKAFSLFSFSREE